MGRDVWYLTPRQWEVLDLTAQGKSTKEIAYALGCTLQTAKNHRTAIYAALDVSNAIQALRVAGYIDDDHSALRRLASDVGHELGRLEADAASLESRVQALLDRASEARRALSAESAA